MTKKIEGNKRARSPDSSFLPSSKKLHQEKNSTSLYPVTISKKKELKNKEKKLPSDIQEKINLRIFDYIVAEGRPLSTVESTYFRDLLKEIDPKVEVMCVATLKKMVAKAYINFKDRLRIQFNSATEVCLTADIWGSTKRSFMGVTAHWLVTDETGKIERKSAGVACKRFEGKMFDIFQFFLCFLFTHQFPC